MRLSLRPITPYNVGSILRRLLSTARYWTASAVLMLSLRSTDAIPPQYGCYPSTVRMVSPAVLMLSPAVLMLSPTCTDAIPSHAPMLPPHVLMLPPQYWIASTVLNRCYTGWFKVIQHPYTERQALLKDMPFIKSCCLGHWHPKLKSSITVPLVEEVVIGSHE